MRTYRCTARTQRAVARAPAYAPLVAGKRRIAFLHGTAGNAAIAQQQMAALAQRYPQLDIVVVEGARIMTDATHPRVAEMRAIFGQEQVLREYARGSSSDATHYDEVDAALRHVEEQLAKLGEVHVLAGFSQGAIIAAMVAARAVAHVSEVRPPAKLLLACPPALTRVREHASACLGEPVAIDAVVVGGRTDEIVPNARGVCDAFEHARYFEHASGHQPLPVGDEREFYVQLADALQL